MAFRLAVYTAEDVVLAIDHGVDGVIVSNHGGRQLDSVTATLEALPECVEAAAGRIPVHIDSGFRRGTDIFKVKPTRFSMISCVYGSHLLTLDRPWLLVLRMSGLDERLFGDWQLV